MVFASCLSAPPAAALSGRRAGELQHRAEHGDRYCEDDRADRDDEGRLKEAEETGERRFVGLAAANRGLAEHFSEAA
jgi:hypothetical protein